MTTSQEYRPELLASLDQRIAGLQTSLQDLRSGVTNQVSAFQVEVALTHIEGALGDIYDFLEELWDSTRGAHGQRAGILLRLERLEKEILNDR